MTRLETLIENNIIHATGSCIKICADMNFWFEAGKSTHIIIQNNNISAKRTKVWVKAIIDIDSEILSFVDEKYFMRSIEIYNNNIEINDTPLVYVISSESLSIKNNYIKITDDRIISDKNFPLDLKHCKNVEIDNNHFTLKQN